MKECWRWGEREYRERKKTRDSRGPVDKKEKKEERERKKKIIIFFFFKQKTAYEIYQCDWSSDVCSSDLGR